MADIEDILPLTPMQQGMLFHSIYSPEASQYFEQSAWILTGPLDVPAFKKAWQLIMDRHSALRAAFVWEGLDEPMQVIHRGVSIEIEELDWSSAGEAEQEHLLQGYLLADREKGFDLSTPPLMRLALIRTAAQRRVFVWSHHHTLLDGWSQPVVFDDFIQFYLALQRGETPAIPPACPYRNYIAWLKQQDLSAAEAAWRAELQGFEQPGVLKVGFASSASPAAGSPEAQYQSQKQAFSAELSNALYDFSRRHQVTLNTLLQAAWGLLLSHYTRQSDVVFGATVSGRPPDLPGAETIVGLLINTLPVRVRVSAEDAVLPWLQQLQTRQARLRQFEYCSLTDIQGWSDVPRGTPLFESLLVFENYPVDPFSLGRLGGLTILPARSFARTNYPLTVVVSPGRPIALEIAYETARFDSQTVGRMLEHLQVILEGITADPTALVSGLPILTAEEKSLVLETWNNTGVVMADARCAHVLFDEQARRTPGSIAVEFQGKALTYADLDRQANRIARRLAQSGVRPGSPVALCLDRSLELIAAILGVLKAGAAFLPLDPRNPPERLAYILEDSQATVLLTQTGHLSAFKDYTGRVVCLDVEAETLAALPAEPPEVQVTPADPAYVIYTSGSTGRPKGVLAHHHGLLNFAHAFIRDLNLTPESAVLQFASCSFDASVAEIFAALLCGGRLVLVDADTLLSPPELTRLIHTRGVNTATLPPSMLDLLDPSDLPGLTTVVSVGDVCPKRVAEKWAPGRRFFNGYGPTETTIGACWGQVRPGQDDHLASVPIGRPIANMRLYLLDQFSQPVPPGVPGEIFIAGVGVTLGYLNRPELTAERFLPDPFTREPGGRMYRTGDLGRFLPDGRVEFLGRLDHQVKVRGYRIELGEIEAVLAQHPAVRQAVVLTAEDKPGETALIAFVLPADAACPPPSMELYAFLKSRLPVYMVPAEFVVLGSFPMLPSGKVDRKQLSAMRGRMTASPGANAPRTPLEQGLAEIWRQILNVETVRWNDSFFELGGHSLVAARLVSAVREVFQVELPLADLFNYPVLSDLAARISARLAESPAAKYPPIYPRQHEQAPLSFAQQRLWFIDQLSPGSLFYNLPMVVRLKGRLDLAAFQKSLDEIVRRHEVLRTRFTLVAGKPVQEIRPSMPLPVRLVDLTESPAEKREALARRFAAEEAGKPFDLANGPLLRAALLRLELDDHVAVLVMHHIVTDGWSMGILLEEFAALYAVYTGAAQNPLTELPVQYADYTLWQRDWLQGEVLEAQLAYWKEQLAGLPPILELPTDRPRPAVMTSNGDTHVFHLPKNLSEQVKQFGKEEGATLFMTLLACFQALLARYSSTDDIAVGTVVANRNVKEVEGLIGFFVNTLVMRARFDAQTGFRGALQQVRRAALGAYAHQDLPFETLVEALQPPRDLSHSPLFQVMFVLDPPMPAALELPGLSIHPMPSPTGQASYDLTLSISSSPDGLIGALEFNTDLWERSTIERFAAHYQNLLSSALDDPEKPVWELEFLSPEEKHTLLVEWNNTAAPAPVEKTAHRLFEERAAQLPGAEALVFQGEVLSYEEVNARANRLAHYLRKSGVGPETLVGISLERSFESIIAILGVLKAGGAYLPLDPSYPAGRLGFMISDAGVRYLLTQSSLSAALPEFSGWRFFMDSDWPRLADEPAGNPAPLVNAQNLAYVIYTSGSTGRPKGAALQHAGLCNLAEAQRVTFEISPGSRVLQFSPFSFDASVWETFMALANGGTLVLARQEVLASGLDLLRLLQDARVSHVTLPPSVLQVLPPADLPGLKVIIAAGEACPAELVAKWAPGRRFFNAYGPTETTVCASMYLCAADEPGPPPIGRPIANTRLYILDRNLQPVPVGVPGELLVGGVSLARGYLNRPELTAERFIPDPFSKAPGARLYRTGDLVRYRADGNIEFLGRIDGQVKVRGFRIELGEIEAALLAHPDLRQAAVAVHSDRSGSARLVAYVVPAQAPGPAPNDLREHLRQTLPDYMLPSFFVTLESLPLSPSGKIDRKNLPAPDLSRPDQGAEYVAPQTPTEQRLAEICAGLLEIDRVGIYDNFFDLGGHSLLATQFISRIREEFAVEVPLRMLFEHPMVAVLTQEIDRIKDSGGQPPAPTIRRVSRDSYRVRRPGEVPPAGSGEGG